MSFSSENGYVPITFDSMMDLIRQGINVQFNMTFTPETFVGTNYYKYFYTLVQRVVENQTKASEIFLKLQSYIAETNARIQRPSVSLPGLIDSFESKGYVISLKPMSESDRGAVNICVLVDPDADDFPEKRLEICTNIKDFVCAGVLSYGDHTESILLSNGQAFEFSFYEPVRTPVKLMLTLTLSDNYVMAIPTDEEIRISLFENIQERYRLGWDFEPQRYFTQEDAPWAATIKLEYSDDDGITWEDEVYEADFRDLFTLSVADITVGMLT